MSRTFRLFLVPVLITGAALGGAIISQAQGPPTSPADVLGALLTEVRGLRAAMEQMAAAGPRVQLALGRLQLQEQRVNTLARRLEVVKANVADAQKHHDQVAYQARQLEKATREATDLQERKAAEMELPGLQREVSRAAAEVQRLAAEESALHADIAGEQARWSDFNQRLEELERALGRQ